MDDKKNVKLNIIRKKYVSEEKLIIARTARKTIRYIEKNTENFPTKYSVLRNKIISTCYEVLEWVYRANVFQDLKLLYTNTFITRKVFNKFIASYKGILMNGNCTNLYYKMIGE